MAINIDIPEAEVRNAIAVAVAESFSGEKKDALIRDIVRAHLQYKEREYDKETILGKKVGNLIRSIAIEQVDVAVESMRPDIEQEVSRLLGPAFKESVIKALRKELHYGVISNITIHVILDKEDD